MTENRSFLSGYDPELHSRNKGFSSEASMNIKPTCLHKRQSTNRTPLAVVTWCKDCNKVLETRKPRKPIDPRIANSYPRLERKSNG